MVYSKIFTLLFITFLRVFTLGLSSQVNNDVTKDYIVYMGSISNKNSASDEHLSMLGQVVKGRSAEETLIRSYKRSFNGFAARLTQEEYENLKGMKEVVSVFPSRILQLHTTRSWDFLGLPEASSPKQQMAESDVIIGVIDTGIWPESPSFNDDGLGPVPMKWKGGCHGGQNFTCNRKIIGARSYTTFGTARDEVGHGSHTASTAAGRKVEGASFYDIVKGTIRGGVPSSRIAVYKVCDSWGCTETGILAAFDDAIADGVDLITISVGGNNPVEYTRDSVAIGAFHAMAKGILTVQSAGNDGEKYGSASVGSVAPWIFTVAANFMDRRIVSRVVLSNGQTLIGNSVNTFKLEKDMYPLVYGETATNHDCDKITKPCENGCLDESLVKGKILVCNHTVSHDTIYGAIAVGILDVRYDNVSFIKPYPAASLDNVTNFPALQSFISSTKDPMANIMTSEAVNYTSAPVVAQFSSRGPNRIASDILKPDISAPGVDILAAFSPTASVSHNEDDKRSVMYSVLLGTSMSCPHVAGAAAYVKSVHPDWSPAAIKSALMTTASLMNPSKGKEAGVFDYEDEEFAYGSGQISPSKATDPGLVYEAIELDYITFLCNSGYDSRQIGVITGNSSITCTKKPDLSPNDVNYPSLSALVNTDKPITVKFSRTVTNVCGISSTYRAKVASDSEILVTVKPDILTFKALNERQSFDVIVVSKGLPAKSVASASIIWSDGSHMVRSPVVVYTN